MLAVYGHPFSSYTWKALIPLYANGTDFTFRRVGPDYPDHAAFVRQAHPAGKFPVLVDADRTVVIEATSIVEHLALHHPGPAPLIPSDPQDAARVRMLDRVFDNYVMGSMQRVVDAYLADGENPDRAQVSGGKQALVRSYHWLENWLSSNRFPPHISLVSCAAAPSLFYADWVEPIGPGCPRLRDLRAELLALPAVARCVDDARPYRDWFPPGAPDRD